MLFSKENITRLLPQRHPILMVSTLESASENVAETTLDVPADNMFVTDGRLAEPGIVEHIAQSASVLAGYNAYKDGLPAPVGYIGEVKKCVFHTMPNVPCTLRTTVEIVGSAGGVSLLKGACRLNDGTPVCDTQMKIFVKSD